jgi:polyol permease family
VAEGAVVGSGAVDSGEDSLGWIERIGIYRPLAWGFPGLLLFMVGDGVESGFLAPYLKSRGISVGHVALVFTVYGISAAIASWCSGVLSDMWGPRRVMMLGAGIWVTFEVMLLTAGFPGPTYALILVSYGLRGFGYPLFAFGFLIWITAVAPTKRLGTGVGWFWFAFTRGLPTLGSLVASGLIPAVGQTATFWVSLGLVVVGAAIALVGVREPTGRRPLVSGEQGPMTTLLNGVTILWRKPRIGVGCVVRAINTAPEFGFLVFLPTFFATTLGFGLSRWLQLLAFIFLSNIIWNLLFGVIGDKLGWRRTVTYCGGVGCTISTLLLYYVPVNTHSYGLSVLVGVFYGATLAGYVPLSALMPSMAPEQRGGAMSALNLGAGASVFIGPAIVGIFLGPLHVEGVMLVFAGLYLASAGLSLFLPTIAVGQTEPDEPERRGIGRLAAYAGGTLLGHPPIMPNMPNVDRADNIDFVLIDVGGVVYDDDAFAQALLRAASELSGGVVDEREFWECYDTQRAGGRLRLAIAERFVPDGDVDRLSELAKQYWEYPESSLYPDVRPTLAALASRYKLGLVGDTQMHLTDALRRDGLEEYFSVVALPEVVGEEKPDPRIFRWALEQAGAQASRTVLVANRLDTDIRPAQRLGIRTVWLLRGEAPPAPTLKQLGEPDAVITSLTGLPTALARVAGKLVEGPAVAPERVFTTPG